MKNFFKKIFNFLTRKKTDKNYVTVKEVKQMYKNLSKNDLIRIIIKLTTENERLKLNKSIKVKGA